MENVQSLTKKLELLTASVSELALSISEISINQKSNEGKTQKQKFNSLLESLSLSTEDFAKKMGFKPASVYNQLCPSKPFPKWAKSMLIMEEIINEGAKQNY